MTRPRGLASWAFPCLLLLFLLAAPSALALDATFDFYPKTAESCLTKAAKASACSGDTAKELNTCLCGNGGGFIEKAIQCLVQQDSNDVGDVYSTMDSACDTSGTPLSWKWSDWVGTIDSAKSSSSSSSTKMTSTSTSTSSTTSTSTSSTTSTESTSTTLTTTTASSASSDSSSGSSSSPSSNPTATTTNSPTSSPSPVAGQKDGDSSSSSNLSTTATIGLATGVSVVGVAAIAGLAFFLVRKRKRASPLPMTYSMLTPEKYDGAGGGAATTYPPHDPSAPNLGGAGAGFDSEANEAPLYTVPTYMAKSQRKQSYTALSSTSPDSGLEQQQQHQQQQQQQQQQPQKQHNFLSGWEPPTHAQYSGPYAPPQTGPVELPPQMQPVPNVFELDSHGVVAAPRPAQPALQPIAERPRDSRLYRPYMPTG